eukprot:299950_1
MYKSVMVHVISHGSAEHDAFLTSDLKQIEIEFLRYELSEHRQLENIKENLIKVIFHHGCRGYADYFDSCCKLENANQNSSKYQIRGILDRNKLINNNYSINIAHHSNCVIISGNIKGRSMSDSGKFTQCIVNSFSNNLKKCIKDNFNSVVVEIGRDLEQETNQAELCNINGTLRYSRIRFEKSIDGSINMKRNVSNKTNENVIVQMTSIENATIYSSLADEMD